MSGQYVLEKKSEGNTNNVLIYSATSTAVVGLTKEINDMKSRSVPFDWGDMLANIVGVGLAVVIIVL